MFELPSATRATIVSVTPRREKQGGDDVPAASVGLSLTVPNTVLQQLDPQLLDMLYREAEEPALQPEFEEARVVTMPLLRSPNVENIGLATEVVGATLRIAHGIDDSSAIVLTGCKVDKVRVAPLEGGTVEVRFRVGTSEVDEDAMGKLAMKIGAETSITLVAPKQPETAPLPIEAEQAAWPFPVGDPARGAGLGLAPGADVLPMGTPRTRRGKDATAAFIAANTPPPGKGAADASA